MNNLTKANYVRSESENRTKRVYPLSLPSRSLKLLREYCSKPQRWRETTTKRVRDATTESKRKRTPQGPTSQTMSPQTNLIPPTTEALKFTPRSVKNPHRPHNRSVEHPLIPGGRDTRTECRHSSHIVLKWDAAQVAPPSTQHHAPLISHTLLTLPLSYSTPLNRSFPNRHSSQAVHIISGTRSPIPASVSTLCSLFALTLTADGTIRIPSEEVATTHCPPAQKHIGGGEEAKLGDRNTVGALQTQGFSIPRLCCGGGETGLVRETAAQLPAKSRFSPQPHHHNTTLSSPRQIGRAHV